MDEDDQAPVHSIEDLDQQIEDERRLAAIVFESSYSEQVIAGISAIGEINQIANARIQTDTRVAAARIASQAEVTCIELLSTAELAALKVDQLKSERPSLIKVDEDKIIHEITDEARIDIETGCNTSVEEINKYGEMALSQINENMNAAIAKIQQQVAEVKSQIQQNEVAADEKLERSKTEDRTLETVKDHGEEAKKKFAAFAKEAANQLSKLSSEAIADINKMSGSALAEISTIVSTAEIKIKKTKDIALTRLKKILDQSIA